MLKLRDAVSADAPAIFQLISELAEFEKLEHEVTGNTADLERHLFAPEPYARVIMAESDGALAGFALYLFNYSTFLCRPGIYLEDLFVRPAFRGLGIGGALLRAVEERALAHGCGRLEWSVLDWNESAINFYQAFGARPRGGWTVYRKELPPAPGAAP